MTSAATLLFAAVPVREAFKRRFGDEPLPMAADAVILDSPWKLSAFQLGFQLISVLAGLMLYASLTFPYIARDWGGGAKPIVTLFLKENPPRGVPGTRSDAMTIGPVPCIQETEQAVVIEIESPEHSGYPIALAIDRRLIQYLRYDATKEEAPTSK